MNALKNITISGDTEAVAKFHELLAALVAEHEELRPRPMTRVESRDWLGRLHIKWRAVEAARAGAER